MSAINMTTQFEGQTMLLTEEKEKKTLIAKILHRKLKIEPDEPR